jgi:large subunit ribosomal protein L37Ae
LDKKAGPGGAFGARYGTVARKRYVGIVAGMRQRHECPRCRIKSVRRLSVGIWYCRKCGYKFAGGAYLPQTKLGETSRRVTGALKPPVTEAVEQKEEAGAEKRRKEKVAKKPKARPARREKEDKAKVKREKRGKKEGSKEEPK